ncbi:acyl-CoA thioesterase [Flavisphingomonas formosensis]|uniref:acyl-CoA thioesterase n=1 Tax=Flavisphingomonas formosensis TaxID=861534 RepID=UPI0012F94261|nr:thioesterase family protein [Sphingomonas formosensis]
MTRALRPRSAYRHWTPIPTRWHDNDAYGHVNNAVHYGWFDTAINAWLIKAGLLDVSSGDPIGLVVETSCRYAAPLSFPQTAEIGIVVAKLGTSSVTYHLGVFAKGCPDPVAEGQFTHVYVARGSRRPVALPENWRAILEGLS